MILIFVGYMSLQKKGSQKRRVIIEFNKKNITAGNVSAGALGVRVKAVAYSITSLHRPLHSEDDFHLL